MYFTYGYLFYIPVNMIYIISVLVYGIKKKKSISYYIFAVIMAIYLNGMIPLVYFPIIIESPEIWGDLKNFVDMSLDFSNMGGLYQILGNILVTIPIGILLPLMIDFNKRERWIWVIWLSCALELVQLLIIYFAHSINLFFDIKDVFLNAFGGVIGCILFEILAKRSRIFFSSKWLEKE